MDFNKILVLGSKGNLGQKICEVFSGATVIAWDKSELDITDASSVMAKITEEKPDVVINCAAYNDVDGAEGEGKAIAELLNGHAPSNIADACNMNGAIFVHFSSGQVFDGNKKKGYNEGDETSPVNAYGASKLMGEVESAKKTGKLYIVRTEWLYGEGSKSETSKKSFVDIMLEMAEKKTAINGVVDEFGKPTYVGDLAKGVYNLIESNKPFGTYHVVNSGIASRYDWAKEIFRIKNISAELKEVNSSFFPRKAKRPKYEILNNTKLAEFRPWEEALAEYLNN